MRDTDETLEEHTVKCPECKEAVKKIASMPISIAQFAIIMNALFFLRSIKGALPPEEKKKVIAARMSELDTDLDWWGPDGFDAMLTEMIQFGETHLAMQHEPLEKYHPEVTSNPFVQ